MVRRVIRSELGEDDIQGLYPLEIRRKGWRDSRGPNASCKKDFLLGGHEGEESYQSDQKAIEFCSRLNWVLKSDRMHPKCGRGGRVRLEVVNKDCTIGGNVEPF